MSHKLYSMGISSSMMVPQAPASERSLVVFDAQVQGYEYLVAGVVSDTEVVVLDPQREGAAQIAEILAQHRDVTQVHLVSHGAPGCLYLGAGELSLGNLATQAATIQTWFAGFAQVPSLLIYGCNVAAGDAGSEFLEKLHALTQAPIAASKTRTGNGDLGGDWNLEVTLGNPVVTAALRPEVQAAYAGVLAPLNADDYTALKALYLSTGGAEWTNNDGWKDWDFNNTTPPDTSVVATWFGVGLTGDRVTSLELGTSTNENNPRDTFEGNNLVGVLPTELGLLTAVSNLKLARNGPSDENDQTYLTGPIPDLGNLNGLVTLWLFDNQLTGSIPSSLENSEFLFWLDLANNDLTGTIPSSLGNLGNLENLNLFGNELEGPIPSSFANLSKLKVLDLSNNNLTGTIPTGLGSILTLDTIILNDNALRGPVPADLATKIAFGTFFDIVSSNLDNPLSLGEEISDKTTAIDQVINFTITTSDLDKLAASNPAALSVTATSSDQSLIPDGSIVLGSPDSSGNRSVSITPASGASGIATITLTVDDGEGGEFAQSQTFEVVVGNVNTAPSITTNALTVTEGQKVTLTASDLQATDPTDLDPQDLKFTVSNVTGGKFVLKQQFISDENNPAITEFTQKDVNDGKVEFVTDGGENAPTYNVIVTDSEQQSTAPAAATVTFNSVNDAPTLTLANLIGDIPLNADRSDGLRVADIVITDPDAATSINTLKLSGTDADLFEIGEGDEGRKELRLKATANIEALQSYDVTVEVDDTTIGNDSEDSQAFTLNVDEALNLPTVELTNVRKAIRETIDTNNPVKVADIVITDTDGGTNTLSLTGADADLFEIFDTSAGETGGEIVRLKAGVSLDRLQNPILDVTVQIDDPSIGLTPDSSDSLSVKVVATDNDFNGNGFSDIVWRDKVTGQNAISLINLDVSGIAPSVDVVTSFVNPFINDPNWEIQAVGNFNGDGSGDLVWRNKATGQNLLWLMKDAVPGQAPQVAQAVTLQSVTDRNWSIAGAGDFNGDGQSDLLWYNPSETSGEQLVAWYMDGTTKTGTGSITEATTDLALEAVGDLNNDGNADLLWSKTDGSLEVWFMDSINRASVSAIQGSEATKPSGSSVAGIVSVNDAVKLASITAGITFRLADGTNEIWALNGTTKTAEIPLAVAQFAATTWQATI